ncbi:hypothetical protein [Marinigracilibium pacificum]|uniref:Cadherin domain-containing protein n=1 Tax=Marinigracilibium pacificum TaxID=2729599 RepID=A0A848IUU1_9BACT|nr:hypothetical protein [Marinigracilibium pacificum]NMM46991.1 hypothetical protein [Marinigracilibium pacificum]
MNKFFGKQGFLIAWLFFQTLVLFPQNKNENLISFPQSIYSVNEGDTLRLSVNLNVNIDSVELGISGSAASFIKIDSGQLFITPDFNTVTRLDSLKDFQSIVYAKSTDGSLTEQTIWFRVIHTNRKPKTSTIKKFYVQYGVENKYQIDKQAFADPDGDPVVFIVDPAKLPQGLSVSQAGEVSWKPSRYQFNKLRSTPYTLQFFIEDQPHKLRSEGELIIETTQIDLPPQISMVPQANKIEVFENSTVNIKFFLSDPNGDDDISGFHFVSDKAEIEETALRKNTASQYEMIWTPSYDFVGEESKVDSAKVTFFVLDKSGKKDQKEITIIVNHAENLAKKDRIFYEQYLNVLSEVYVLSEQLEDTERKLEKDYKRARKGKKNRSILNATLGATTGLSPIFLEGDASKMVSGVGGTTVVTINTLEATEVIGRSAQDLLEKRNICAELKIEIITKADAFARKYAFKENRRNQDFQNDYQKLMLVLADKRLVRLELDPSYTVNHKITEGRLKKKFNGFQPETFDESL